MTPSANTHPAVEGVQTIEKSLKDECADMQSPFPTWFHADDVPALGIGHVAKPPHRATHFLVIQPSSVNPSGVPRGHLLPNRDQIGAGGSEHDDLPRLVWAVLQADEPVDVFDRRHPRWEIRCLVRQEVFPQSQGPYGIAALKSRFPFITCSVGGDELATDRNPNRASSSPLNTPVGVLCSRQLARNDSASEAIRSAIVPKASG
jgi:hypothetical protein